MLLSHYCKQKRDSNFPQPFSDVCDHDGHKPGGLWVGDEESGQGWRDLALKRRREDPNDWRYHPKQGDIKDTLKFRYDFRIRPGQHSDILEIRNPTELAKFTEAYGEANPRPCLHKYKSGSGFGLHIDWKNVKKDFKGILGCVDISPQPDESGGEMKEAKVSGVQLLKPGEDPAVMLYFVDEAFDQMTLPV